ncbi:hypothetical protein C7974DRAFT_203033 [Boeremia exigua]|uniref:uncharacterized protein n=1 Tax=Boeremia exigua TaxID=749465 RepID=UPI001E8E5E24|nr:uncharacterized protein C7974DRAFT_203033 [Boeremia exigua]KAH6625577.1 hypothetical protein C7974DRAFT_203033 [Boeremia exigua]
MANLAVVNPLHDSRSSRPHTRRNSTRRSFASSLSRSSSYLDSPRTACPQDGDAFAYNPAHLKTWDCPQSTWDSLPNSVQKCLAAVQHAGASALTGFERLHEHREVCDGSRTDSKTQEEEILVNLDELRRQKFRTTSNASSIFMSDVSSPTFSGTPASDSGSASPVPSTFSLSQSASNPAPISLGPPELEAKRTPTRERSFSTPLEPQDAKYASELSYLRTEALPRLRHAGHKVDTEWYEAKRTGSVAAEDAQVFESWWSEIKCTILKLSEHGKRLAEANGVTPNGMGWTAP